MDETGVSAPSVITLNAVAAAHATNDYLMAVTGLLATGPLEWTKYFPREEAVAREMPSTGRYVCRVFIRWAAWPTADNEPSDKTVVRLRVIATADQILFLSVVLNPAD